MECSAERVLYPASAPRTNLPKESMAFPDFPFDPSLPSFLHHSDVLAYLDSYAEQSGVCDHIRVRDDRAVRSRGCSLGEDGSTCSLGEDGSTISCQGFSLDLSVQYRLNAVHIIITVGCTVNQMFRRDLAFLYAYQALPKELKLLFLS